VAVVSCNSSILLPYPDCYNRSRVYSFFTFISFAPIDPTLSTVSVALLRVTKAAVCGFTACGIQCDGCIFKFEVEEPLLAVLNFSRRRPVLSVGIRAESRRHDGRKRTLGMQQHIMPTAASIGEKQTRHHDAPMGSELTSPNTFIAQSMRRTARIVALHVVSIAYLVRYQLVRLTSFQVEITPDMTISS
jgi:hypothetical protein